MNHEELMEEQKTAKRFVRVTMNGSDKDFSTKDEALEYVKKKYKDNLFVTIRTLSDMPRKIKSLTTVESS